MTPPGDDLEQARIFVTSALSDMDKLLSDLRLDKDRAVKTVKDIQTGAKNMKARGIYRAAQTVIESYQSHSQQPKIDGRLMALYKLVIQYSDGLNEIAPIIAAIPAAQSRIEIPKTHIDDNYNAAKDTLTELLPLAGGELAALDRLLNLNLRLEPESSEQVSFESLMPDVTDTALRNARGQGKSVSISYAAENLFLDNSQVEQVRDELDRIVERLVRRKIGTPDQRQIAGLSRSGHIDISATQGSEGLDISVLCEGETVHLTPGTIRSEDKLIQEVGT